MKKITNKRLMSLILSVPTALSLMPSVHAAQNVSEPTAIIEQANYLSDTTVLEKEYDMNGVYNVMVGMKPVYVYLGNDVQNEYLPKMEALYIGENNYEKSYIYSKTVDNPNYIPGVSSIGEKKITIYALSGKTSVSGWTRINRDRLSNGDMIATSIELGEFLLKGFDLSSYRYNMLGFANVDINKDGVSNEIMYLGNNKINTLMTKEEAIIFGLYNYKNYYIQSKTVPNPDYISGVNSRNIKVYAVSDKSYVPGWIRISKSKLPSDAVVASNVEYMNALVHIKSNVAREIVSNIPDLPINPVLPGLDEGFTCSYLSKDAALEFAHSNPTLYSDFCIRFKVIYNPRTKTDEMLFTFDTNTSPYDNNGWAIIGNDYIPSNANIFLTMNDACNYEFMVKNNIFRTL